MANESRDIHQEETSSTSIKHPVIKKPLYSTYQITKVLVTMTTYSKVYKLDDVLQRSEKVFFQLQLIIVNTAFLPANGLLIVISHSKSVNLEFKLFNRTI